MERTISRSELRSTSDSPPPAVDDEAVNRFRNLQSLDYATQDIAMPDTTVNDQDDEELDFRLFTTAKPTAKPEAPEAVQKIRLRSPSLDFAEAGFIHPRRRESYYFAAQASEVSLKNYEASALSSEQVLELSRTSWPGSAYPWKVLRISPGQVSRSARLVNDSLAPRPDQIEGSSKHARLGKQARIRHRAKLAKAKADAEAKSKASAQSEEAERDKKTRRNREKKAKKKAREQAKKAAGKADDALDVEESANDSGDD